MSFSRTASIEGWAPVARLRQGLYRFFGGALLPPDEERLRALAAAAEYLDRGGLEGFAFYGQWRALGERLREPLDLDRLNADYVRLFGSRMGGALCPPVESHYRAKAEGGGVASLVAALQREYRKFGLSSVNSTENPDHVSTELEVLSALCGREYEAWEEGDVEAVERSLARAHAFLRRHLCVWLPLFRGRVRKSGAAGFYPELVEAGCAFVIHDADFAGALLEELK